MEKFIEIHNDFLSSYVKDQIENVLLNEEGIRYSYLTSSTNPLVNVYQPGFKYMFIKDDLPYYHKEVYHTPFLNILYNFCKHRNIFLTRIIQGRAWLNIPSISPGPELTHTDWNYPHWVLLYYVNDSDGDTILFNDKEEEIQRITPQKGKAVFFNGEIKHCASQPVKNHRSVINFNFLGDFFGNEK